MLTAHLMQSAGRREKIATIVSTHSMLSSIARCKLIAGEKQGEGQLPSTMKPIH